MGLLEPAGRGERDAVRARVDLRPYAAVDAAGTADWWVVSDLGEVATGRPLAPDHVLGVGGATVTLARCTIRTPVARRSTSGPAAACRPSTPRARGRRRRRRTTLGPRLAVARLNLALNGARAVDLRRATCSSPPAARSSTSWSATPRSVSHPADAVRTVVHLPGRQAAR